MFTFYVAIFLHTWFFGTCFTEVNKFHNVFINTTRFQTFSDFFQMLQLQKNSYFIVKFPYKNAIHVEFKFCLLKLIFVWKINTSSSSTYVWDRMLVCTHNSFLKKQILSSSSCWKTYIKKIGSCVYFYKF